MSRSLPIYLARDPMPARVHLQPSGDHFFEMEMGMQGHIKLKASDVPRLKAALDAYEVEVMRDDGHTDRINPATRILGEF